MARIKTYEVDNIVSDNDIVIGSDTDNNDNTKNFKVSELRDYILGGIEPVTGGNLKITTIVSNNVLYTTPESYFNSSVTPIVVLQYEIIFLILNGKTFIFRKNNATYGVGQTQTVNSDFTEVDVTANINENLQDLDSVLSEGNTAPTRSVNVNELGLLDDFSTPTGYGKIYADNLKFWFKNKLDAVIAVISNNNMQFNVGAYSFNMSIPAITANRTATFQNTSGTVAYLSDIPATPTIPVQSVVGDEVNTFVTNSGGVYTVYYPKPYVTNTQLRDSITNTTIFEGGGLFEYDAGKGKIINSMKFVFNNNIGPTIVNGDYGVVYFLYEDGRSNYYNITTSNSSISTNILTVTFPLVDYWGTVVGQRLTAIDLCLKPNVIKANAGPLFDGAISQSISKYIYKWAI
jgi:hypothetical protein